MDNQSDAIELKFKVWFKVTTLSFAVLLAYPAVSDVLNSAEPEAGSIALAVLLSLFVIGLWGALSSYVSVDSRGISYTRVIGIGPLRFYEHKYRSNWSEIRRVTMFEYFIPFNVPPYFIAIDTRSSRGAKKTFVIATCMTNFDEAAEHVKRRVPSNRIANDAARVFNSR